MKLRALLQDISILDAAADLDADISGISYDSRTVAPGQAFVAVSGFTADGHKFIPMAREKGAAVVICEKKPADGKNYVRVESTRAALARMAANWYGHPTRQMTMIGVTGTNGKTSITY